MNRCSKCNTQTNTLYEGVCEECAYNIARALADKMMNRDDRKNRNMDNSEERPKDKVVELARSVAKGLDDKGFKLRTDTDYSKGDKMYVIEAQAKHMGIGIYIYHHAKTIKFFFAKLDKQNKPIADETEKKEFNFDSLFQFNKYYQEVIQKIEGIIE